MSALAIVNHTYISSYEMLSHSFCMTCPGMSTHVKHVTLRTVSRWTSITQTKLQYGHIHHTRSRNLQCNISMSRTRVLLRSGSNYWGMSWAFNKLVDMYQSSVSSCEHTIFFPLYVAPPSRCHLCLELFFTCEWTWGLVQPISWSQSSCAHPEKYSLQMLLNVCSCWCCQ